MVAGTASYIEPRLTQASQVNLNSGTEPRSLSDIINFTQKANLNESQLIPDTSGNVCVPSTGSVNPCEQALRTANRNLGTSQVYKEACAKYACPGGMPVPKDVETATVGVGASPYGVGIDNSTNLVYVANGAANSVSVIDAGTNTVLRTISLLPSGRGPFGVAVNPSTHLVYVANQGSSSVSVINGTSHTIVANITSVGANGVAVNSVTNRVYSVGGNVVSVINGTSNKVLNSIAVGTFGTIAISVGVSPKLNRVYVTFFMGNSVIMIQCPCDTGNPVITSIPIPGMTNTLGDSVAVNPSNNRVYVICFGCAGQVAVIDGSLPKFNTTINVFGNSGIAVNPGNGRVYAEAVNSGGSFVSVINGTTNIPLNTIAIGFGLSSGSSGGVAVNPNTNLVYATNSGENTASVIGQREEIRDACLPPSISYSSSNCLVISSTGTLFPGTSQATAVNLVAVSLRSNTTKTGTQMALTIFCDYKTTDPNRQCSAFYVDGNVWGPGLTDLSKSPFIIQNAEPYFYLQFHWWDFANSLVNIPGLGVFVSPRIVAWGTWWYGATPNPNWFWGVYWWWRTYVNYYIPPVPGASTSWLPWWWWSWHWMYWRYWSFWNVNFST